MCKFCIEHGEGKKWYLQMKNYSSDLERSRLRRETATIATVLFDKIFQQGTRYMGLLSVLPPLQKYASDAVAAFMRKEHFGQVVPIEDAETILSLANPITLVPCVCKKFSRGHLDSDAVHCIGFGFFPRAFLGWFPEFGDKMIPVDKDAAFSVIKERHKHSAVSTVWTYRTPYIGKLCNCDVPECAGFKFRKSYGSQTVYKSEYRFSISSVKCTGCRICEKQCAFSAVRFDKNKGICSIIQDICVGCGNCRDACPKKVVEISERPIFTDWEKL